MARTFLAVFFLGVCLHEAYVEGKFDKRRYCIDRR